MIFKKQPFIQVNPNDFQIVWVENYWDYPVSGLALVGNKLHYFYDISGLGDHTVSVQPLSFIPKLKWLLKKRLFEICVGYHWTYGPKHKEFDTTKRQTFLYKVYYAKSIWRRKKYVIVSSIILFYTGQQSFEDFMKTMRDL